MRSKPELAPLIVGILLASLSVLASQSGMWHWWAPSKPNSLVQTLPVVVMGEYVEMKEAPGIQVKVPFLLYESGRTKIMMIRIDSVLKGKELVVPGSTIEALAIPEVSLHSGMRPGQTFREALEESKQTGKWPTYRAEVYPEPRPGEPRIFFLGRVKEGKDPTQEETTANEVTGIVENYPGRQFYSYAGSLVATPEALSIVMRYIEINAIADAERREQELLKFSLSLIEDRNTPESFAANAAYDLRTVAFSQKSALERMTDDQIGRLTAIATQRSRPKELRSQIADVLSSAHELAGREINVAPFLRVIGDTRDDEDLRYKSIYFLERLNTSEVREGFKKILRRTPQTREDELIWQKLSRSEILKEKR